MTMFLFFMCPCQAVKKCFQVQRLLQFPTQEPDLDIHCEKNPFPESEHLAPNIPTSFTVDKSIAFKFESNNTRTYKARMDQKPTEYFRQRDVA